MLRFSRSALFSAALLCSLNISKAQSKGNSLIQPLADLQKNLKGKLERIMVHGKSLEGNLEGDSADRDVFVYCRRVMARELARRYPVVYTLHGYGLHAEQWVGFANVSGLEKGIEAGTTKEMILVSPGRALSPQRQLLFQLEDHGRLGNLHRRGTGELHR